MTFIKMARQSAKSRPRLVVRNLPREFWAKDYDEDASAVKKLSTVVPYREVRQGNKYLVIGHLRHANWSADMFSGASFEVMNIFRDCVPRAQSMIRFFTFKSQAFFETLEKTTEVAKFLRVIRRNASACLAEMGCLEALFGEKLRDDTMSSYLCGTRCRQKYLTMRSSILQGAMEQLTRVAANTELPGLAVCGITELMFDSYELLECVYPSYFSGIASLLNRSSAHANPSGTFSTPAMQEFAHNVCQNVFDDQVYAHALKQFNARSALVRKSWKQCCRHL